MNPPVTLALFRAALAWPDDITEEEHELICRDPRCREDIVCEYVAELGARLDDEADGHTAKAAELVELQHFDEARSNAQLARLKRDFARQLGYLPQ